MIKKLTLISFLLAVSLTYGQQTNVKADPSTGELIYPTDFFEASGILSQDDSDSRYALSSNTYTTQQVDALAAKPFPPALHCYGASGAGVELPAQVSEFRRGAHTLALWVTIPDTRPAETQYLSGVAYGSGSFVGYFWGLQADGRIYVYRSQPGGGTIDLSERLYSAALPAGSWSGWLVSRYDESGIGRFFVHGLPSGLEVDVSAYDFSDAPLRPFGLGNTAQISGSTDVGLKAGEVNVYLHAAAIYNRALPDAEIAERYGLNPTKPVTSPAGGLGRTDDLMATYTDWDDTGFAFDSLSQSGTNGFTASASGSGRCWASTGQSVQAGYAVRVAFDVANSGSTFDTAVLSSPTGVGSNAAVKGLTIIDAPAGCVLVNAGIRVPAGTTSRIVIEMILTETAPNLSFRFVTGGASTITVDNFEITSPGLLVHYSASQSTRAGDQLHDLSGIANDALITDGTFTEPTASDFYRARDVDATTALYLGRAGDILPANAVVTSIIIDGTVYPITNTQPTDRRRIRLVPNGADLDVQRSDGTSHTTLVSTATVGDLSAVNLIINYQLF